jgi:hypothetical protein
MNITDVILLISSMPLYGWIVVFILAIAILVLALNTKMNIKIDIKAKA